MGHACLRHAEQIARTAHAGQTGPDGAPFIEHPLRVANAVASVSDDPTATAAALLHDTVEKGGIDWSDLAARGVSPDILSAVDALTRRDGEEDGEYLSRCRSNPVALQVKRYDLLDKLHPDYLARLPVEQAASVASSTRQKLAELDGH